MRPSPAPERRARDADGGRYSTHRHRWWPPVPLRPCAAPHRWRAPGREAHCGPVHVLDMQRMMLCNNTHGSCSGRTRWSTDGLHPSRAVYLQYIALALHAAADLGEQRHRGQVQSLRAMRSMTSAPNLEGTALQRIYGSGAAALPTQQPAALMPLWVPTLRHPESHRRCGSARGWHGHQGWWARSCCCDEQVA